MSASVTSAPEFTNQAFVKVIGHGNVLKRFVETFFAHLKLIISLFLGFSFIVCLMPFLMEKRFTFTGEVIILPNKTGQSADATQPQGGPDQYLGTANNHLDTEVGILRSQALIQRVVTQYIEQGGVEPISGLMGRYVIEPVRRRLFAHEGGTGKGLRIQQLTTKILDNLDVSAAPGSNVIRVVLQYPDRQSGRDLINKILDKYLVLRAELESNDPLGNIYRQKKLLYREDLADLERNKLLVLGEFNASHPDQEMAQVLDLLYQEQQKLNRYEDRLIENQEWLDFLNIGFENLKKSRDIDDYAFSDAFVNVGGWLSEDSKREFQTQMELIGKIAREYARAQLSSKSDISDLQRIRARYVKARDQDRRLISKLITQQEKQAEIYKSLINKVSDRLVAYRQRIGQLNEAELRLRRVDREEEVLKDAYFTFSRRYEKKRSDGLDPLRGVFDAKILERASVPIEPASPNSRIILPWGFLAAFMFALSIGFLREFLDHRFKYPSQVTKCLGLPVIATLNEGAENPSSSKMLGPG